MRWPVFGEGNQGSLFRKRTPHHGEEAKGAEGRGYCRGNVTDGNKAQTEVNRSRKMRQQAGEIAVSITGDPTKVKALEMMKKRTTWRWGKSSEASRPHFAPSNLNTEREKIEGKAATRDLMPVSPKELSWRSSYQRAGRWDKAGAKPVKLESRLEEFWSFRVSTVSPRFYQPPPLSNLWVSITSVNSAAVKFRLP